MSLTRFWLRFAITSESPLRMYRLGFGVTAYNLEDALRLIRERFSPDNALPPLVEVIQDVDVRILDAGHVRPNMGPPCNYGIWYPFCNL